MLQISKYHETQLINMSNVIGKSVDEFLDILFEIYQAKSMLKKQNKR